MVANEIYRKIQNILLANKKDLSHIELVENKTDFTIKIFDAVSIKVAIGKTNYLYIKNSALENIQAPLKFVELKSKPGWPRTPINDMSDLDTLTNVIVNIYDSIQLSDPFGCCSRFTECSDAKKCIRDDIRAKSCIYRQNLESGKIFYGANRNV